MDPEENKIVSLSQVIRDGRKKEGDENSEQKLSPSESRFGDFPIEEEKKQSGVS